MKKSIKLSLISVTLLSSLQAQTIIMKPITITSATKTSQSIKDITSNVNVITAEEIEEKQYTTVVQALNSIAGVNFTSNGGLGTSSSVYLRGLASKRVLVLIDGIRYNDITSINGAPFAHLMMSDIKQIEVVKGAQSGIWGADASAGVINIITKSAKKGTHISANMEYGTYNSKKYGISLSHKADNYYIKLSSQRVDSDSFTAQAPRGEDISKFEDDAYENTTSNIKAGFNITDTNKIDISHTIIDADGNYDGGAWSDTTANKANNSTYTSSTNDQFSSIKFNHIDSFNEIDIYANRSIFERDFSGDKFDGETYEYGLKSNISYREKDFVVVGFDYKTFEHKNDLKKKYTNKAFFITNNNHFNGLIGGQNIFTQSLRVDTYDKFEDKTTGKLGFKHIVENIKDLSASGNIGTAYNVPTLYQLNAPGMTYGDVFYPIGNKDLTPETTTSYDISINYKSFIITYFNNQIEDMIDYKNGYENIDGTSTIRGIEIEYSDEIIEDILISTNYTHLSAKDKDDIELARRVRNSFYVSVDYYGIQDFHFGINSKYTGLRYDEDDKKGEQTGRYTVTNLIVNYDINKNFQTYIKADNITDKYYQVVDGYATAGRSFYLGLKAQY